MDFAFLNAQLHAGLRGVETFVDVQNATVDYMYLVGLYGRWRYDFA